MNDLVALRLEGLTAENVVAAAERLVRSALDRSDSFLVMRIKTAQKEEGGDLASTQVQSPAPSSWIT